MCCVEGGERNRYFRVQEIFGVKFIGSRKVTEHERAACQIQFCFIACLKVDLFCAVVTIALVYGLGGMVDILFAHPSEDGSRGVAVIRVAELLLRAGYA